MANPNGYIQGTDGNPLELVDITARRQLAGKLNNPGSLKTGDYLRVQRIGADGTVALEGVQTPGEDSGQNVAQVEPAEDDIPCVYLDTGGAGMPFTKDEGEKQIRMVYESRTQTAEYYLTAKVQGSSSASNPNYKKRNWTFKFYKDSTYEEKLKLTFRGWPAMNKFVLKAGWVMPGHLRNVGAAQIWGQIMRSRPDYDTLPEELRKSANQGATDGFHSRVFIDGAYWGIYDWIVAKDQLFGQDKDNPVHSILNSELNNQPTCAFATTTPTIGGNWSEELLDDMTADTKTSMENWIKFVAGSTDEEFVANAENYFDVQSVIDANCFDRIMLTVDNMCRNQIVFKYDKKWFMGKWDLDAILGLPPVAGQAWYPYDTPYQEGYVAYKDYGIINMLYKRTEELFLERFKARYRELRNGPLSENNLNRTFGKLSDRLRSIEGLLAEENASTTGNGQFTAMPNVGKDTIQQIREFVVKRCAYMDEIITNMVPAVPATGITLSSSTLTFDSTDAQTLVATVEPPDTTDTVLWESSNNGIATVENGVVTPIANGNATITATAGNVSATCAVTVQYAENPCTSINMSQSELTFDGDGSQTLVATVTPENTTDVVVWETSDATVATVDGGVVTAIGNGAAIITARCGEHSAMCAVTVSGVVPNILRNVEWHYGGYNGNTGAPITSPADICTDLVDISAYAGQTFFYEVEGGTGKIVFWDAAGEFISGVYGGAINRGVIPDNAATMSCCTGVAATCFSMFFGADWNQLNASKEKPNMAYSFVDGSLASQTLVNAQKIDFAQAGTFVCHGIVSGAFFDETDAFVSGLEYLSSPGDRIVEIPDGVASAGLNYLAADSGDVWAYLLDAAENRATSVIGEIT